MDHLGQQILTFSDLRKIGKIVGASSVFQKHWIKHNATRYDILKTIIKMNSLRAKNHQNNFISSV